MTGMFLVGVAPPPNASSCPLDPHRDEWLDPRSFWSCALEQVVALASAEICAPR